MNWQTKDGLFIIDKDHPRQPHTVCCSPSPHAWTEEEMFLIASAPQMLQALKCAQADIKAILISCNEDDCLIKTAKEIDDAIEMATQGNHEMEKAYGENNRS